MSRSRKVLWSTGIKRIVNQARPKKEVVKFSVGFRLSFISSKKTETQYLVPVIYKMSTPCKQNL